MSGGAPSPVPAAVREAAGRLTAAVDAFRSLQDDRGVVVRGLDRAGALLDAVCDRLVALAGALDQPDFAAAFAADAQAWRQAGLDSEPCFDRTQAAYRAPADKGLTVFAGPLLATNGPAPRGYHLECFVAMRDEPDHCAALAAAFPHPKNKCQSARLLAASAGIRLGNCIVFFPENIRTRYKVEHQHYALFFFNKFQPIYLTETMPRVRRLFGEGDALFAAPAWRSAELTPEDCYRVRCMWGYLHDYFHHRGPRPLDQNLQVKLNWFTGLLEEIKCDCQTALAALDPAIAFGPELFEFVLFERMFRYPGQPDAPRNFDAGTGVLLFEWLVAEGAIVGRPGGGLRLDLAATAAALQSLVARIEGIERLADEAAYKAAARSLVRSLLPEGAPGDRFRFPDAYASLAETVKVPPAPIDFGALSLY